MPPDAKTWFVFIWAALFSGVAILLRVLRDLVSKHEVTKRDLARAVVELATVAFFGGLFGWGMALMFPHVTEQSPTVVAIGAALMAYSGLTASQGALYRMFSAITGTTLLRREDELENEQRGPKQS